MSREHTFETTVVTYLRMYHHNSRGGPQKDCKQREIESYVRHTDMNQQRRSRILDEYLSEMNRAPPKVAMSARDVCPRCDGDVKLLLCAIKSIMSCPCCGYSVAYLDATSSSTSFDEVVEYSQYSYKRVNHY